MVMKQGKILLLISILLLCVSCDAWLPNPAVAPAPPFVLKISNTLNSDVVVSLDIHCYHTKHAEPYAQFFGPRMILSLKLQPSEVVAVNLVGCDGWTMGMKQPNYGICNIWEVSFYDPLMTKLSTYTNGNFDLGDPLFSSAADRPFYLQLDPNNDSLAHFIITGTQ
jgi:hypothetical protein